MYSSLESTYNKYKDQGLRVLAFPANNFGQQEPGTNKEIKKFCRTRKKVTFDVFAKVSVKGDDQIPLYQYLTNHPHEAIAGEVAWNFQKYLVGRDGTVLAKWDPRMPPTDEKVIKQIEKALAASSGA